MIAAIATLVFLSTLWMLVVVGAAVLKSSGSRMFAALKGEGAVPMISTRPVRVRHQRYIAQRPARVSVRQRAAA